MSSLVHRAFDECGNHILSYLPTTHDVHVAIVTLRKRPSSSSSSSSSVLRPRVYGWGLKRISSTMATMHDPIAVHEVFFRVVHDKARVIDMALGAIRPSLQFYMRYMMTTCVPRLRKLRDKYLLFLYERYAAQVLIPSAVPDSPEQQYAVLVIWKRLIVNMVARLRNRGDGSCSSPSAICYIQEHVDHFFQFIAKFPDTIQRPMLTAAGGWKKAIDIATFDGHNTSGFAESQVTEVAKHVAQEVERRVMVMST